LPARIRGRLLPLLALAGITISALAGWWLSSRQKHAGLPSRGPEDDLPLVPAFDAGERLAPAHDILVAAADELYLARIGDRTIVSLTKPAGTWHVLARLDGPAWGMALAHDTLWLTTVPTASSGARRGAVLKLDRHGGAPLVVADGLAAPRAVASDGRWVFVIDVDASTPGLLPESSILRISTEGGEPTVIAQCKGEVADIALDETHVYWADRLDGSIVAAPKLGGDLRVLAKDRGLPREIVVDDGALYWVEERSESLWTMPKAGGPPRRISQDFAGFVSLTASARDLWWVNKTAAEGLFHVLRVPKTGGDPILATPGVDAIGAIASDGTRIYWEHDGGVSTVD
jgi:hypothetical protein